MSPTSAQLPSLREYPHAGMGYLCSRIHALSVRLLSRGTLESAQNADGPSGVLDVLLESEYGASLRADIFPADDLAAFETRLFQTYAQRLKRVRDLTDQCAPADQYLVSGEWDMHWIQSMLRSCLGRSDATTLHLATGEIGMLSTPRIRVACQAGDAAALLEQVAESMSALADELRHAAVATEDGRPSLPALEQALARHHYRRLLACAAHPRPRLDRTALRRLIEFEIDLANLRVAIRRLEWPGTTADVDRLYIDGGAIPRERFRRLLHANEIGDIFAGLQRGPLSRALERGMVRFLAGNRPSVFERFFDEQRLILRRGVARRRPVSLATPLWYLGRAANELVNLRIILRGVMFDLPSGALQERLVHV